MKRIVSFGCILLLLFSMCACKKKQVQTQQPATSEVTSSAKATSTPTPEPTKAAAPTSTTAPTATSAPTAAPTAKAVAITNDLLVQNMMALNSYYRSILSITSEPGQEPWEEYDEFAYVKDPFAEYTLLDFRSASTTSEDIILGDIYYSRMNDEKWTKSLPGNWYTERTPEYRYELSTQHFPIDYGKLTFTPVGNEKVNGVDCVKYALSGKYDDEYIDMNTKFRITLSGTGHVWISADPVIKEVIIRQRVTFDVDMQTVELKDEQGNPLRSSPQVVIEDDITMINSTVIQPPPESEVMTVAEYLEETEAPSDNISVAEALAPGTVTQQQAEAWIGKGWETNLGRIAFEWVNGYLLGSWVWSDNTKIESSLTDYVIGTMNGNMLSGDAVYSANPALFEFTMDTSGESFTGRIKVNGTWYDWTGQAAD